MLSLCASLSIAYPSSSFHVGVVVGAAIGGFVGGILLTAAIGGCLACAVFCRSRAKREVTAKKELVCKGLLALYSAVDELLYTNVECNYIYVHITYTGEIHDRV